MNFSFTEDQVLLRNSVRAALDEQCKPAHVRAMMDDAQAATATRSGARWPSSAGSACPSPRSRAAPGLGLVELALVLEEMGRAAYPGPYFASVVLGGLGLMLGGSAGAEGEWLLRHRLGPGARRRAALLEDSLDWDPAATTATATTARRRLDAVAA